jgi:methyl-accepting chemotaxis protein
MMVTEVVPVWQRHVEASRAAVERGIGDLLASFSQLCDGVMAASQHTSGTGDSATRSITAMQAHQDAVLTRMLDETGIIHQRREQLLAQLSESLLQLDAIEADLRSSLPADAQPLLRLEDSRSALALLAQQVAADTRGDHERQDRAFVEARQALVQLAIERTSPEAAAGALQSLSARIEKDLEQVLIGMQFQDRLNQTLSNVTRDMQRFTEWMRRNEHASHADAMRWLTELERSYTMQEQRARHNDQPGSSTPGDSVEFF